MKHVNLMIGEGRPPPTAVFERIDPFTGEVATRRRRHRRRRHPRRRCGRRRVPRLGGARTERAPRHGSKAADLLDSRADDSPDDDGGERRHRRLGRLQRTFSPRACCARPPP